MYITAGICDKCNRSDALSTTASPANMLALCGVHKQNEYICESFHSGGHSHRQCLSEQILWKDSPMEISRPTCNDNVLTVPRSPACP